MTAPWGGKPPGDAAGVDGWWWLHEPNTDTLTPEFWDAACNDWHGNGDTWEIGDRELLGPCLTPAQHAAALADAEARGMERAAKQVSAMQRRWEGARNTILAEATADIRIRAAALRASAGGSGDER